MSFGPDTGERTVGLPGPPEPEKLMVTEGVELERLLFITTGRVVCGDEFVERDSFGDRAFGVLPSSDSCGRGRGEENETLRNRGGFEGRLTVCRTGCEFGESTGRGGGGILPAAAGESDSMLASMACVMFMLEKGTQVDEMGEGDTTPGVSPGRRGVCFPGVCDWREKLDIMEDMGFGVEGVEGVDTGER